MQPSDQDPDFFLPHETPRAATRKKRPGACTRCRNRKVKCDGQFPVCGNCMKAGTECDANTASAQRQSLLNRLRYLEALVKDNGLENSLRAETTPGRRPEKTLGNSNAIPLDSTLTSHSNTGTVVHYGGQHPVNHAVSPPVAPFAANVSNGPSPCGTENTAIGVQQPIAHEVGMLSLSNSVEPKYIGPSSGVTFARLIYAAASGYQGIPVNLSDQRQGGNQDPSLERSAGASLPNVRDMHRFINAYFDTIHFLYPFLSVASFSRTAERIRHSQAQPLQSSTDSSRPDERPIDHIDHAQLFLVLFLGANVLETRLSQNFNAESFLATAMIHVSFVSLHESLRGLQTLLLLTLSSLHSPRGLNAWFLKSNILAGCIDLGLQRKKHISTPEPTSSEVEEHRIRSGIFWSAYSLDRTLSVVLGRPLTFRDEALDIEFPDGLGSDEVDHDASRAYAPTSNYDEPSRKRQRLMSTPVTPATYSFRFDRIFGEIKLMLYRVAQSPSRFPWPTDFGEWQTRTRTALSQLLEDAHLDLDRLDSSSGLPRGVHDNAVLSLDLKYHQAIMLMYRPSPAIPRPSALALKYCFESAVETIQAQAELHRFGNFANSWLNAHTVFISGITICYCFWVSQQVRSVTAPITFTYYTDTVKRLLKSLSTTWLVASNALQKFEALVRLTETSSQLRTNEMVNHGGTDERGATQQPGAMGSGVQQGSWPPLPQVDFSSTEDLDWSVFDVEYGNTDAWPEKLQEVPDWFVLADWLHDYA
ncbi:hypothetical protein PV08_11874 [Exophiala spinifera]|uniref:Zn(2)-C6 fungal-type domain-containing protein n=1 Tax=Exophiala spinifera TaxID=91928 RepID=A0A0D2BEE5_9EURO|nr:uncharacterized protein PV08_11874 [Exophiala spinifera]KIW09774.1 hypothetical protein PV08_11874 [Exophiala spinifera]